jgi:hypothetical protein
MTHVARALTAIGLLAAVGCSGRDTARPEAGTETGAAAPGTGAADTAPPKEHTVAGGKIGPARGVYNLNTQPTIHEAP